jgi:hypothetical protein
MIAEFPLQLDLNRDASKYIAPNADRSTEDLYTLHRQWRLPLTVIFLLI